MISGFKLFGSSVYQFSDDHRGSFVRLPDGRWVWSTFYHFQWDLNYANPAVFRAMAGELLFLANLGVEVFRMDAVAFIWKKLNTPCESLPEAHKILRAFNCLCRIAAPLVLFESEAIVHPDEVVQYIDRNECRLSYNPLQMALTWEVRNTLQTSPTHESLMELRHLQHAMHRCYPKHSHAATTCLVAADGSITSAHTTTSDGRSPTTMPMY